MTVNSYKKAIAKLLKAYHKKWDAFGNKRRQTKKKKKKMNYDNHQKDAWLLIVIIAWVLLILTITIYV
jgi:hypothetical protein